MAYAGRTFAGHLRHFSRSVDIVHKATFDEIRNLVIDYAKSELGPDTYFELLRDQQLDGKMHLQTFWSSQERFKFSPLRDQDHKHTTPAALSFDRGLPLWIVATDKRPLGGSPGWNDLWSEADDLPVGRTVTGRGVSTLVVVPLRRKRVLGVFCLEASSYLEATEVARTELQLLSDALANLLELWDANESQSHMTGEAITDLRDLLSKARFPRWTKPQIFVAFSDKADPTVTSVIRNVLHDYEAKMQITYWDEMYEAGNVTAQIGDRIAKSMFGICYLSEPVDDPNLRPRYRDNANVIFEAGMLHALTNAPEAPPAGWIPIREVESPKAPFDFSQYRTLDITRTDTGGVPETFETDLKKRVNALLGPVEALAAG